MISRPMATPRKSGAGDEKRKKRNSPNCRTGQCLDWERGPALHGRYGIREATRQRILQIARQIGYTPNLAARALSTAKSAIRIGVCIPREIHFFYDHLWGGVLDEARRLTQLGVMFEYRPVRALGEQDTKASRISSRPV